MRTVFKGHAIGDIMMMIEVEDANVKKSVEEAETLILADGNACYTVL